jgi:uncharacterized protein YggE
MKQTVYLFTFLCVACFSGISQTEKEIGLPYIEVNGAAELNVIPDQIFITITIKEKYDNKEKVSIESQEEKLKVSLKEINVDIANLSLTDANAIYMKVKFKTKDVLTSKRYLLKVTDATTAGLVFHQLEKLDIFDADISKVDHSKIDSLRKVVKLSAIKAAKAKADYLLLAIGEQTGKALIVRENEEPVEKNYYRGGRSISNNSSYANTRFLDDSDKDISEEEIQFQKIKVRSSIYVKFGIK